MLTIRLALCAPSWRRAVSGTGENYVAAPVQPLHSWPKRIGSTAQGTPSTDAVLAATPDQ